MKLPIRYRMIGWVGNTVFVIGCITMPLFVIGLFLTL